MSASADQVDLQRRILSGEERLLMPGEVGRLLRVDAKTVTRWAKAGKLTTVVTLGGHRRLLESEVLALLAGEPVPARKAVAE